MTYPAYAWRMKTHAMPRSGCRGGINTLGEHSDQIDVRTNRGDAHPHVSTIVQQDMLIGDNIIDLDLKKKQNNVSSSILIVVDSRDEKNLRISTYPQRGKKTHFITKRLFKPRHSILFLEKALHRAPSFRAFMTKQMQSCALATWMRMHDRGRGAE